MCNVLIAPVCGIAGIGRSVTSAVGGSFVDSVADSAGHAAGDLVTKALGWWTYHGSVSFDSPVITTMQSNTMPITTILLTLGVIVTGVRMALARKAEPLVNLTVNLVTFLVAATAGVALFAAIQTGGDAYSEWVIAQTSDDFGQRLVTAATSGYTAAFGVIVVSLLCLLLAFVQWVLMLFRYAGLLVLACVLPVAGGAAVLQGRAAALRTVVTWSIAILLYKPIAATVYAIGFTTIGQGDDLLTLLQGVVVLLLAVVALPALVKLFSWTGSHASSGGGGVAAVAGVAGGYALSTGRGAESQAAETQAAVGAPGGADSPAPTPASDGGGSRSGAQGSEMSVANASAEGGTGGGAAAGGASAHPYVAAAMAAKEGYDSAVSTASSAATDRRVGEES